MKASIINAVPANSGDKLLLDSSLRLLKESGFVVQSIHSNQLTVAREMVDANLHRWDLDRAVERDMKALKQPIRGIIRRMPDFYYWPTIRKLGKETESVTKALEASDWIFSSAGGYLNSRYGYEGRLRVFEWLLGQGKQLVLLPQSIGPFDSGSDHRRLREVLKKVRLIMLRDDVSVAHLRDIGVSGPNVSRWPDLGLLSGLFAAPQMKVRQDAKPLRVLFCAREWSFRSDQDSLAEKLVGLLDTITESVDVEFVFASTCQGVQGYCDDSIFMSRIRERMKNENQSRVNLVSYYLNPASYHELAHDVDCYIGMRMHGAIMALHAGTPSLAIGYEEKSREVFSQLSLNDCCMDMNDSVQAMTERCRWFFDNLGSIRERVRLAMKQPDLNFSTTAVRFKNSLGIER